MLDVPQTRVKLLRLAGSEFLSTTGFPFDDFFSLHNASSFSRWVEKELECKWVNIRCSHNRWERPFSSARVEVS
jgi:hypothetical protein